MGMKTAEYKKAIATVGLSQNKAAAFLGFSTRQSRRIAKGEADLSEGETLLLKVMIHLALTPEAVHKIAGVEPPAKKKKAAAAAAQA